MYRNYIFDLYGTLVDIKTDEEQESLWNKITEFYGFSGAFYEKQELREQYMALCKKETNELCQRIAQTKGKILYPEIQIERIFRLLYEKKGISPGMELLTATAKMFRILSTDYIKLYDGTLEVLSYLKAHGKHVFLLSNAQYIFTAYEINYLGLTEYFDGMILSSCERCRKPDPVFFETLFCRYKLKKEESVMIGNEAETDIKGAALAGIDSLYLSSNLSPKEDDINSVQADYVIPDGNVRDVIRLLCSV